MLDDQLDIVMLNQCSSVLAHAIARDGKLLYEKEPGEFERFRATALMSKEEQKAFIAEKRAEVRRLWQGANVDVLMCWRLTMTIAELIKALSQFDSETPVVVRGYEAGFNDVSIVELKTMQLNVNNKHYYGAHDCVKGLIVSDQPMTEVVYLGGFNPICDQPELSYR